MKKIIIFWILLLIYQGLWAVPQNLYEQLCEVNQEWRSRYALAEQYGLLHQAPITAERDILQVHFRLLEQYFRQQSVKHLSERQQQNRIRNLNYLRQYRQMANCPQNTTHTQRIPVFIDHENRYCAVAYLMWRNGKAQFTENVRQTANHIYIRQIDNPEFLAWQQDSGLSLDELAWIQPGYMPAIQMAHLKKSKTGAIVYLDSTQTRKIYHYDQDNTDMFGMGRIFMGMPCDTQKRLRQLNYQGKKPVWEQLKGNILEIQLYRGELYASTLFYDYEDTTHVLPPYEAGIYCWKNAKWHKIKTLENNQAVYAMSIYQNKLYCGGGKSEYDTLTNQTNYQSYLATWDGQTFEESNTNYNGYIFAFIYQKPTMLLGIVRNKIDELTVPNPLEVTPSPDNANRAEKQEK